MRYPVKESRHSSHALIAQLLGQGKGRSLLDVGCADGQMAERFASNSWRVTGVEPFSTDAARARQRGIRVLEMSLQEAIDSLDERFDAVVLADVLEHIADPWTQLSRLRSICAPGATIIISIPNIAHLFVRVHLALGRFDYQDRGILDRTHLRFFTRRTILEMVDDAGLHLKEVAYSPTPFEILAPRLLATRLGRAFLDINAALARARPTLFGYQVILACEFAGDSN